MRPRPVSDPAAIDAAPPPDPQEIRPESGPDLWKWIQSYTGVRIAWHPVCTGHTPPWPIVRDQLLRQPPVCVVHGPRGGGKSFGAGLITHAKSRWSPKLGTRILGGSKAQSVQIYQALAEITRSGGALGDEGRTIAKLLKESATYRNGAEVAILAASPKSVRGPHVPCLILDEVDEIDVDIREAAMGMMISRHGVPASLMMLSTWHKVAGGMAKVMERAEAGEFPLYSFCIFEVLERCPEERSGAHLEKCPECPIVKWCHADMADSGGVPKAKRSDGHYAIETLITQAKAVSERTFESDFLSMGPRPDSLWFKEWSAANVSALAEYDQHLRVLGSLDSGVCTGGVLFQVRGDPRGVAVVNVFGDYYAEGVSAEDNARAFLLLTRTLCGGRLDHFSTDPSGGFRNPVGPTVLAEYQRAGLTRIERWPIGPVGDSLALLEALIHSADGRICLIVHPRCKHLISAIQNYRRAKRGGQWQDYPEDPPHPSADLVDALRGGLKIQFPEGRKPKSTARIVSGRSVI